LLERVPRDDVARLVRQDAGQHVDPVRLLDESSVDVDVTARKRECIDGRIVDDLVLERAIGEWRYGVDALTDHLHIGTRLWIVDELNLLLDLRGGLISKLPFFVERDAAADAPRTACRDQEEKWTKNNRHLSEHRQTSARCLCNSWSDQGMTPCLRRISFVASIGTASAVWPLPVTVVARSNALMIASSVASIVARNNGDIASFAIGATLPEV